MYWDIWANYWKNLAELCIGSPESDSPPTRNAPKASREKDPLSPHEKYEYLTEYGTQILCLLKPEEGCSYLSRNFESITGNDIETCMGATFFDIVHPDFKPRFVELLQEKSRRESKPVAFRCKLRHGDGKWYWYLFLIHGKQASGADIVCVAENVHDSIQIQNSLQKAKLEAELALRARSEFLANMSHDLRTPLNAVIGFAQMLEGEMFGRLGSPHYMEYAKHIQESGYDLLSKIEDLLEISNIEAGRISLDRDEVSLSDLLKNTSDAQLHHASAAGVSLRCVPCGRDVLLYADRVKLQHILGHLVTNAIRHCEQNGEVTLSATLTDQGGLLLKVSDNGAGMPKARLEGIVSALQEETSWSAKCNNGTGLGLALTKEFITLHGGTVEIESAPGHGTTVSLLLPPECVRGAQAKEEAPYLLKAAL